MSEQENVVLIFITNMGIKSRGFVNQDKVNDKTLISLKCILLSKPLMSKKALLS